MAARAWDTTGDAVQRVASTPRSSVGLSAPAIVHEVLRSPGRPLEATTRGFMEPRLAGSAVPTPPGVSVAMPSNVIVGAADDRAEHEADATARGTTTAPAGSPSVRHDLGDVRVHTDGPAAASAQAVGAEAYTVGRHVVFGSGAYAPHDPAGRALLAHELAHVAQAGPGPAEPVLRRSVEMRDIAPGGQSGSARLPELIDRLNAVSPSVVFSMAGAELTYTQRAGTTATEFERRMMAFVDQAAGLPLILTNRHGLLGNPVTGFHQQVDADSFAKKYVDIDDLLASSDLGLQSLLVHFLTERAATTNYAERISTSFTAHEFDVGHKRGIHAERDLLRDYFDDQTIRFVADSVSPSIRRVFRNGLGDTFRRRITRGHGAEEGVHASSIEVITSDKRRLTDEEYRTESQVRRERSSGATEYREGARGVPAP